MMKLLIVDDEEEIRRGIRYNTDWESNDITVCGEAQNGTEALKLLDEISPDIVIIDIRMPEVDGLKVIENIGRGNRLVKSIVLSGYDDFAYAQKALKYGASDYLLKPCRSKDILASVLKVKSAIEDEYKRKDVFDRLKIQFNESLPFLKERFLSKLLHNELDYNASLLHTFDLYKIGLKSSSFTAAVLKIDNSSSFCSDPSNRDIELLRFAVKNVTFETLLEAIPCEVLDDNNHIVVLANTEITSIDHFSHLMKKVKENLKEYLNLSVSIGISNHYECIKDIALSYREALKSLEMGFFLGSGIMVRYDEIQVLDNGKAPYPLEEEKNLINAVKIGNKDGLVEKLDAYINAILSSNLSKDSVQKFCLALLLSVYHLCIEKGIDTNPIFGGGISSIDTLVNLASLTQVKDETLRLLKALTDAVNNQKSTNRIIELVLKYIHENFHKELSLDTVAGEVYINPRYLSVLFKQSMGSNFVDYVQKIRIEKACEILKDVRIKTYEAAAMVGFNDERYFGQIFKKLTGMTPTQYKDSTPAHYK